MKVLVTGARGFIGRHVVEALLGRRHDVRALVRPGSPSGSIDLPGSVEVVAADLASETVPERTFAGVECLVHLAAALHGTVDEHRRVTVEGTRLLLDAMARSDTRRLVLASSLAVYDWTAPEDEFDETSPLLSADAAERSGPYAAAKWEQEQLTRRLAAERGWELALLRPGFVWGRGQELPACVGVGAGPIFLVVGPRSRPAACYVENCAALIAATVEDTRAAGRPLNVVDPDNVDNWRRTREHFRLMGRRVVRLPVPYSVAFAGVRLVHWALAGRVRLPSLAHPPRFQARFRPVRVSGRAARERLAWRPPWDHEDALRRAYAPQMG